jgi:hypothetical protein
MQRWRGDRHARGRGAPDQGFFLRRQAVGGIDDRGQRPLYGNSYSRAASLLSYHEFSSQRAGKSPSPDELRHAEQ